MQFSLKYRQVRDFERFLKIFIPWLNDIDTKSGVNYAQIVLRYVHDGMDVSDEDTFVNSAKEYLSKDLRGEMMTLSEHIEKRGVEKGFSQGVAKGVAQGQAKIIKNLHESGFDLKMISKLAELPVDTVAQMLETEHVGE